MSSPATPASTSELPRETNPDISGAAHLGSGAKAGIGVGAAIGAVFLGCLAAFWVFRRRRKTRSPPPHVEETAELKNQENTYTSKQLFLDGEQGSGAHYEPEKAEELDSRGVVVAQGPPAELEASTSEIQAHK
ncbi:hypothetical protein K491DRAFT_722615 [Lophiostoma macrostomum CBS 122681]|uniref:Uncharacterized protein n=1 Tax=Lophiostoma macrostomum CBS 122681 TaxID=1314788 RepID=A0A6A6SKI3_9PLEO|nr:hypothetical protein K491DRAFT_722615 [Lophiostoma macrostomum CBS 122681]